MKHQKGLAPIIIVAIVAVIAVAGGAGYFLTQKKPDNGGMTTKGKSLLGGLVLNPNCKLNDPDLCKYMNQALSSDFMKSGFSGRSITVDAKGQKSESLWEMAGEGKSRFVTSRNGKEESNIIMIDGATYMKDYTDNSWFKYPASESSEGKSNFSVDEIKKNMKIDTEDIEDKTKYEKMGNVPCEDLTCIEYKVTTEFAGEAMVQYMYIDTKEYLLRKMKVDDKLGGSTETLFSYKPVTINVPSPVKEMKTDFSNMLDTNPTGMEGSTTSIDNKKLQEELQKIMEQSGQENADTTDSEVPPESGE